MSLAVRPIELPREAVTFVKTWWPIYADDDQWVPPLIMERKQFFDPKKNPYFQQAEVRCFIATRNGQPVGTIAASIDHQLAAQEPGLGLFGFFEFFDDADVAKALFEAASSWLAQQGMTRMRGPYNFNGNHEFGMLIDGFDTPPMIANPHNRSYYQRIYEEVLGLEKAMDWYAYWLEPGPVPPTIAKITQRFLDRNPNVRIREMDLSRFDEEVALVKEIYNDAWEDNWGHVQMTDAEIDFMAQGLKQVIDPKLCYVAYLGDEAVAVSITLPDFNQVAKKMNGRIFPFGWWHYLTGKGKIDTLRIFILGVKKAHQKLPLGAPLYVRTWEEGLRRGVRGAEASLILENNNRMRGALEKLGAKIYKTYRIYETSTSR
ncbi:MAG: N-acetyltransferase [Alphaproteobacteria bacterium]|nr:N-acetyltransferase [Alphaproteobacteria bacterium]MCB9690553.1 N-acetyltransferase [Alphaproteobacteria bacterium]